MLRPATTDDEPLLWAMLGWASQPDGPPRTSDELRSTPELARYVAGWGRAGDVGLVAVDEATGDAIGAAWYRTFTTDEPGYGFVDDATPEIAIALAETGRGRGLGHQLIDGLLAEAHAAGVAQLCLSVRTTNVPAVRVYEDCGFAAVRTEPDGLHLTMVAPSRAPMGADEAVVVEPVAPGQLPDAILARSAWGAVVARLDELVDVTALPAFVATVGGEPAGLVTWRHDEAASEIEVVGIEAWVRGRGVGGALLRAVRADARARGVGRLWLITNNDLVDALRFYQRRGWQLVAVHRGAGDRSRQLKPSIPIVGAHGIPIHHEVELELLLG